MNIDNIKNFNGSSKPPLRLRPKKFSDQNRLIEVMQAIGRYYNDRHEIPIEWIVEYNDLVKNLRSN